MKKNSIEYVGCLRKTLDAFPHDQFDRLYTALKSAYEREATIFVCGNGGSAATASHWVCDMNKGVSYKLDKRFRFICLNDNVPSVMAYSNDVGYEVIFEEQLKNFIRSGDLVIGISGSGNSKNVIRAIEYANVSGAATFGLAGYSGGHLKERAQDCLHIAVNDMQIVEDLHVVVTHALMQRFASEFSAC